MGFKLGKFLGGVARATVQRTTGVKIKVGGRRRDEPGLETIPGEGGQGIQSMMIPTFQRGRGPALCSAIFDRGKSRLTHPNKSTYVTRGGGTSRWPKQLIVHERGTECVTRRRLNPANGRAAVRAVRRLVAFYGLANRVAKQLRKAASRAGIRRGQRRLPSGRGDGITVVDT